MCKSFIFILSDIFALLLIEIIEYYSLFFMCEKVVLKVDVIDEWVKLRY